MKISEAIKKLNQIKKKHGDIAIYIPDTEEPSYCLASLIEMRLEFDSRDSNLNKFVIIDA